jgi:hypothetical protein
VFVGQLCAAVSQRLLTSHGGLKPAMCVGRPDIAQAAAFGVQQQPGHRLGCGEDNLAPLPNRQPVQPRQPPAFDTFDSLVLQAPGFIGGEGQNLLGRERGRPPIATRAGQAASPGAPPPPAPPCSSRINAPGRRSKRRLDSVHPQGRTPTWRHVWRRIDRSHQGLNSAGRGKAGVTAVHTGRLRRFSGLE